ncbi:uncharacterized protein LOC109268424 [Panthera pardus]|uniref:Uncharacterized protein LOC109268424 n=1 Tax=Panthera pardus TaxID=9691 RepID=A0A9W2UEA5_PANPR|nr:uncharacterized protein LOC109268424 [Panthera pardus]
MEEGSAGHPGRERTQEAHAGNKSFHVNTNATQCPPARPGANSPRGPSRGLRARRRESGSTRGPEPESAPQPNFNAGTESGTRQPSNRSESLEKQKQIGRRMRTRQQAHGSPAGLRLRLRLRLGLGLGIRRPRPASQVSLELWAPAYQRAPERPGVCPAAPVRRDPLAVAFPGVATLWGPGLRGEEEFCPDSAAVGSKKAFSWVSPGKVAKLLFTCKNMLFIFQSLLVNLEIADSPAQGGLTEVACTPSSKDGPVKLLLWELHLASQRQVGQSFEQCL